MLPVEEGERIGESVAYLLGRASVHHGIALHIGEQIIGRFTIPKEKHHQRPGTEVVAMLSSPSTYRVPLTLLSQSHHTVAINSEHWERLPEWFRLYSVVLHVFSHLTLLSSTLL